MGEIPTPLPGEGEVLLRVLRIGLRADVEKGGIAAQGIAAEVARVGRGVEDVVPGERYAVQSVVGCGECESCFRSRENLCLKAYHTHGFGGAGAYAEEFVVPPLALAQGCLIRLPQGVDADSGIFIEPLAFCINGMNLIPISNSVHLVVIGAGLTGILTALIGRYQKAKRVTICDPDPKRVDLLRGLSLPFDAVIAGGDDAVARILSESPEGVEAVACTLPEPTTVRRAFSLSAIGGHISLLVPVGTTPAGVDPAAIASGITRRELHVHGAIGANRSDYMEARHMIAEGLVPAAQLITHRFSIAELRSAMDLLQDPAARPLGVCLEVSPESPAALERIPEAEAGWEAEGAAVKMASFPGEAALEREEVPDAYDGFGISDAEVAEMARRVRKPEFNYGPGSVLDPSGEIAPWPELPADYLKERERERQRRLQPRERGRGRGRRSRAERPAQGVPERSPEAVPSPSQSSRGRTVSSPPQSLGGTAATSAGGAPETGRRGRRRRGRGRGRGKVPVAQATPASNGIPADELRPLSPAGPEESRLPEPQEVGAEAASLPELGPPPETETAAAPPEALVQSELELGPLGKASAPVAKPPALRSDGRSRRPRSRAGPDPRRKKSGGEHGEAQRRGPRQGRGGRGKRSEPPGKERAQREGPPAAETPEARGPTKQKPAREPDLLASWPDFWGEKDEPRK